MSRYLASTESGGLKPAAPAIPNAADLRPAALLALVAVAVLVAPACSSPAETPSAQGHPVPVTTGAVDTRDWPSFVEAGGTLRARQTAVISSRILAPVVVVNARAGDTVRRGQVLVELDAAESRSQATRSASSLEAARLAADAAAAEVAGAQAALDLATLTHDRMRKLHDERSATTQELDQAVAGLAAARSRLTATRAAAQGAAAAFEAARAAAQAGDIVAAYGALTAPFDGIVVERLVDPGTMAAPGAPLVVLEDPRALRLEVTVDATRAAGLTPGAPVDVRLDSDGPTASWSEGRIEEIARVDPASQTFVVKIEVPTQPGWRSGFFGRARFRGPSRQATSAPALAILQRGQLTLMFVVGADEIARLRAVRVGERADGRREILAGASPGEIVVVDPPATLTDGSRVSATVREPGAQPATGDGR